MIAEECAFLQVIEQHEQQVKETEDYVVYERERLHAFEEGLKVREEALEGQKQELVSSLEIARQIPR